MTDREALQKEVINNLLVNKRVILQWGTGVGKGYTAVKAIEKILSKKTLILVAERAHKSNWKEEFVKAGTQYLLDNITIECYASLRKLKNTSWDLIIFDEAHHLNTDIRRELISTLQTERVLALSATLPKDDFLEFLQQTFGRFIVSTISLQKAVDKGFLPEPEVLLIPLVLNNTVQNQKIIEEWGVKTKRKKIYCNYADRWFYLRGKKTTFPNTSLVISCTEKEKYSYLSEKFEYYKSLYLSCRKEAVRVKWLQYGSKRKQFLGELKTSYAKSLLNKLSNKRFVCFCSSIEQASCLGGDNAVHSKRPVEENNKLIEDFNKGVTNSLFAIGMLQEGMNLCNIEIGIIIQLDGQERGFIQKFGRSLRAKSPVQYIFYFKDTQDENYLKNVLNNVDNNYISTINL